MKFKKSDLHNEGRPFTSEEFVEQIKTNEEFAKKWGELGPIYGSQWTAWGKGDDIWEESKVQSGVLVAKPNPGINQIQNLINDLKNNPDSRRLIVTAWNPSDISKMTLPPCHYGFECDSKLLTPKERYRIWFSNNYETGFEFDDSKAEEVEYENSYFTPTPKRMLSLKWTQRSVDTPLGLPFNLASYGFLLQMLAQQVDMQPGELIGSLGNTHIYNNQFEGVEQQLQNPTYRLPYLKLNKASSIFDYKYEDFEIVDYMSAGKVDYPLSN